MKSIKHIAGASFGFLKVRAFKANSSFGQKSTTILLSSQGLPNEKRDQATAAHRR